VNKGKQLINLDFEIYKDVDNLKEITNQKIHISNKQERFHPEGLYSEQIFGPIQKFKCQCGKLFGKMNSGKICDTCGVLCGDIEGRSNIFAKIQFPDGIFVVNPIFKTILQQIFGQTAVKSLLTKKDYQTNKEFPYYFSLEKHKLLKENKMKANEKKLDIPVSDLVTLKQLFDEVRTMEEYKEFLNSFVLEPIFLDFIFMNYVLVIPPNSRQIIKISPTKILPHPITKCYSQILKNRTKSSSVSDQLFKANPEFFGYSTYKYQELTNEI
jgi:DNA-directed RNA polymerase beta' subunit